MKEKTQTEVRKILDPIILNVSWAEISHDYFGKSRPWLYHKLTGDGQTEIDFTKEERQKMKSALLDLAKKINECAEKL